MTDDPFISPPARPLWLVTLADLALLLLGFVVLVQATSNRDALARSLRARFGNVEPAVPVAAAAADFTNGSAALGDAAPLVAWAREALADPRVTVTVTGSADASENLLLAADRGRTALAALIAAGVPSERLQLATTRAAGRRATLTLAFTGQPRSNP